MVIAGNGRDDRQDPATLGDGGSARAASLGYIEGLAVDTAGDVLAVDSANFRVRRITPDGTISIVAGNGTEGYSGDGGLAVNASLRYMRAIAVDGEGNVYIADTDNHRLRKVDTSGRITTLAGNGTNDTSAGLGDGGPATVAPIRPVSVAVDAGGRVYVGDSLGGRVRTILPDGTIVTVAGGGLGFPSTTGIAANSPRLYPTDLAFAPDGTLYVADVYFVSRLDLATSKLVRVAGTGQPQFSGFDTGGRSVDGRLAVETNMNAPQRIAVTASGDLYIGDGFENRVWRVDGGGIITTVAGTGYYQLAGDDGPATASMFHEPKDVLVDSAGGVIVADQYNQRVRRIDRSGVITTITGSGSTYGGFGGDGGPAPSAQLSNPSGVALDAAGNLYIADQSNFRIRRVDVAGTITTFALVPHEPKYSLLGGIAVDPAGNVYLSQVWPRRVLKFDPSGTPTTLIGSDEYDSPSASPRYPRGLAFGPDGMLYVADLYGAQVLRVDPTSGASAAVSPWAWNMPSDVAFDAAGNLYVTDGPRVLRLDPAGRLVTVAGSGVAESIGDGGPATSAGLAASAVAVAGSDLLVVDRSGAHVIRRVSGIDRVPAANPVQTFGWNGYGALGDGTLTDRKSPVAATSLRDATAVSAGYLHTLAVRRDGTAWASGWNGLGALGTGTTRDSSTFVQVAGLSGVTTIAAGVYHSLALKSDGTVWAWGWNGVGQLGDGTTRDKPAPTRIPGLTGVVGIAAGALHSVALKSDGSVWTWGWNGMGQLGIGSKLDRHRPVVVPGLAAVRSIAAGGYHTLAATQAGRLAAWGWNVTGQLGDGTTTDRLSPVMIGSDAGFSAKAVAGGLLHSVAVGDAGETWTWGWNGVGQLGDGTTTDRLVPAGVPGLHGVRAITAGGLHTLVTRADQTVLGWGWNAFGQLGDSTKVDRWRPVTLPGVQGVLTISGGFVHSALG